MPSRTLANGNYTMPLKRKFWSEEVEELGEQVVKRRKERDPLFDLCYKAFPEEEPIREVESTQMAPVDDEEYSGYYPAFDDLDLLGEMLGVDNTTIDSILECIRTILDNPAKSDPLAETPKHNNFPFEDDAPQTFDPKRLGPTWAATGVLNTDLAYEFDLPVSDLDVEYALDCEKIRALCTIHGIREIAMKELFELYAGEFDQSTGLSRLMTAIHRTEDKLIEMGVIDEDWMEKGEDEWLY